MRPAEAEPTGGGPPFLVRFVRFALAGVVGFAIEAVVLSWWVLVAGLDIFFGRAVSFTLAVTATWAMNRRFAFVGLESGRRAAEYAGYFTVQVIGALINLGAFVLAIAAWPWMKDVPVLPLAMGAGIALVFNFLASRFLVFRGGTAPGDHG